MSLPEHGPLVSFVAGLSMSDAVRGFSYDRGTVGIAPFITFLVA